ncbi:hypothetical protein KEC55_33920 [Burkholderia cepacia]|uniref:hypothetical protein n=1 Tax=Burkholderia cepacia TaxID=292 RepID=UPI00249EE991|nr:hypothetical protein [Burkholderia cepacia]WGY73047.1 hypothetical protein KEC55_33920 [Burkholderia cepacia]
MLAGGRVAKQFFKSWHVVGMGQYALFCLGGWYRSRRRHSDIRVDWPPTAIQLAPSRVGAISSSDSNNQLSGGSNGNPSNTGAAPVTPPRVACVPGAGCVVPPPLVSPGSPNNSPSNAILSSGNGGNDGGCATGQGGVTNSSVGFDHATAVATKATQYGQTYEQVLSTTGANGRTIDTTFVFMKVNSGTARFVTGIPAKK